MLCYVIKNFLHSQYSACWGYCTLKTRPCFEILGMWGGWWLQVWFGRCHMKVGIWKWTHFNFWRKSDPSKWYVNLPIFEANFEQKLLYLILYPNFLKLRANIETLGLFGTIFGPTHIIFLQSTLFVLHWGGDLLKLDIILYDPRKISHN